MTLVVLTLLSISFFAIYQTAKSPSLVTILAITLCGTSFYWIQFVIHEASHGTLFSNRRLNDSVGGFFCLLAGINFATYRRNHMLHHRFKGQKEDPEHIHFFNFSLTSDREQARGLLISTLLGLSTAKTIIATKSIGTPLVKSTITWTLVLYISSILYLSTNLAQATIIAMCIALAICCIALFLNRLRSILEHSSYNETDPNIKYAEYNFSPSILALVLAPFNFRIHKTHHMNTRLNWLQLQRQDIDPLAETRAQTFEQQLKVMLRK